MVAFCGLGRMGAQMAGRVADAGYDLRVWNRSEPAVTSFLQAHTGRSVATPREAADGADVVITMLTNGEAVLSVLDGADGVLAGLHAGAVVVDCSTTGAELARTAHTLCARAGVGFVDSPVSGSTVVAARGQLGLMVGGEPGDIARVEAVLRCFGGSLVHVGPTGSGAAAKVAVNALLHTFNTALAECLVTAEAQGVARPMLFSVLANSRAVEHVPGLQAGGLRQPRRRCSGVRPGDRREGPADLRSTAVNDAGLGQFPGRVRPRHPPPSGVRRLRRRATCPRWRAGSAPPRPHLRPEPRPVTQQIPERTRRGHSHVRHERGRLGAARRRRPAAGPNAWRGCGPSSRVPHSARCSPSTSPTSGT